MTTSTRERRDWTLLIFIIPIGIILMLIAGQIAIRLVPIWSINAGMQSKLDPNNLSHQQQNGIVQPVLPAILTPLGWLDTFLTPGAESGNQNVVFPPFVIFEPTSTPEVTSPPPTVATTPPSTSTSVTVSPTAVVTQSTTGTQKPPVDGTTTPPTSTATSTSTSTATSTSTSTATSTSTSTATSTSTSTATSTSTSTATSTSTSTATATATGTPSTPPITYSSVTPPPDIKVNAPPNGTPADILPGTYTVLNLGSNPVEVLSTPDKYYDLIYYEALYPLGTGTSVLLDQVSLGISNFLDGSSYYEVFNWGDNIPDTNTNVNYSKLPVTTCTQECDNRDIPASALYPGASGPAPSSGILIDVDTAKSAPPPGIYQYLVIISPLSPDAAQVDAVIVTKVPIPPVPILAMSSKSIQSVGTSLSPPLVDNIPVSSTDAAPSPSTNATPVSSTDTPPSPSATTVPVPATDAAPSPSADPVLVSPTDAAPNPSAYIASVPPTDAAPSPSANTAPVSPTGAAPYPPANTAPVSSTTDSAPNPSAYIAPVPATDAAPNPSVDMVSIPSANTAPNPPTDSAPVPVSTP